LHPLPSLASTTEASVLQLRHAVVKKATAAQETISVQLAVREETAFKNLVSKDPAVSIETFPYCLMKLFLSMSSKTLPIQVVLLLKLEGLNMGLME
jgi:hypothetical protein